MVTAISLYVDDSGTRDLDRKPPQTGTWFGLGGIMVWDRDEDELRRAHAAFCSRWPQLKGAPLHSADIRFNSHKFSFLGAGAPEVRAAFMEDLSAVLTTIPVLGHACVIDRPGYAARYNAYGERRWLLCKTAFCILIERAAKYARKHGAKLRVFVEKTDKGTDRRIASYYDELRNNGMPFDGATSAKYSPLGSSHLGDVLYELKFKAKTSPPIQIADLYLWPICRAAYRQERAYDALRAHGKIIDCVLAPEERAELGIKYSCFDKAAPLCAGVADLTTVAPPLLLPMRYDAETVRGETK